MNIFSLHKRKAFSLIELVTVMGIIAILFSLSVPQLFRLQNRNTLQTSLTKLVSSIRQQQLNSMNSPNQYGIYFEPSKYTLFTGRTYSSSDPANTVAILDYPLQFTQVQFPSSLLIFASGSGEIISFNSANNALILEDTLNHDQRMVQFNSLGVPIYIQR